MILYIVRHGQSERNLALSGPHDCNLTDTGFKQADLAGAWLKGKGIETIYSSPSIRTLQTATAITRHVGVRPKTWADIVEWGYLFDCPGLTGKEMRDTYPDIEIDPSLVDDKPWIAHKNSEEWPDLVTRAQGVLDKLLREHPPGSAPVALVTHAHFARHLIAVAMGYSEVQGLGGVIQHYNCGITAMEFQEERRILWYTNQHSHLGDLITK